MNSYLLLMFYNKLRLAEAVGQEEHGTYRRHLSRHCEFAGAHVHDYLELFWVEKGPGVHWINGIERVVDEGVLQLIRSEDAHALYARPGRDFEWTNVAFFKSSWTALRKRYYPGQICYFDVMDVHDREYRLSKEQLVALRLSSAELTRGARDRLAFERFLLNALAVISRERPAGPLIPAWLVDLDQELRQQANFLHGVAALVSRAGRCPEHVCREYRRYFGSTPTETMTTARMDYASFQLGNTDMKIVDLAMEAGLQNLGHFYRTFEKRFACTPGEYRRHLMRSR